MSIYLIDFENVHYDGLGGILNLIPEDEVYIFYSENGKRLTFELHEQINHSPAKFYYYKATVGGKNALDHQLSTYLGFLIGKKDEKKYYIISKDQGYRYLVTFWKSANLGLEIVLADSIRISRHTGASVEGETLGEERVLPEADPIHDKSLVRQLAGMRRGRQTRTKLTKATKKNAPATEKEEDKPVPLKKMKISAVPKVGKRVMADLPPVIEGEKADQTEEKTVEAAAREKIMSKVIEYVLPQEIVTPVKPCIEAKIKPVGESEPNYIDTTASSQEKKHTVPTKMSSVPRQRRRKSETAEAIKEVKAEEKRIISEAEILQIMPEAKEQGWLADLIRYVNGAKGKAELYNMIRRRLGQEKGRDIYNQLKKLL